MIRLVLFSCFVLLVSPGAFGSGSTGGSGGSTGGASSSGGSGSAQSAGASAAGADRPANVESARKSLRERMQKKLASENSEHGAASAIVDHSHQKLTEVLKQSVTLVRGGQKSYINYKKVDRTKLNEYIKEMTSLSRADVFEGFSEKQRLAYFINLYNALTIELILRHYGKIESIKDIGSLFTSTWKIRFFKLFGKDTHLDDLEHGFIRGDKNYNEPRIHFAVNCASIGCPALYDEAFVAAKLESQLQTATINFLKDRDRNRYNASRGAVELSKIFDWYEVDFEKGFLGYNSLKEFVQKNAEHIADNEDDLAKLKAGNFSIRHTSYNWKLNDSI